MQPRKGQGPCCSGTSFLPDLLAMVRFLPGLPSLSSEQRDQQAASFTSSKLSDVVKQAAPPAVPQDLMAFHMNL
jgi:hypothetical protein